MKVRQLMAELSQYPQNADIVINLDEEVTGDCDYVVQPRNVKGTKGLICVHDQYSDIVTKGNYWKDVNCIWIAEEELGNNVREAEKYLDTQVKPIVIINASLLSNSYEDNYEKVRDYLYDNFIIESYYKEEEW